MRASLAVAAAVLLAGPLFASAARAEDVVTASGHRYDAYEVVILEDGVKFSFFAGEGRATLTLPFDRIAAQNLLDLVSARARSDDGRAQLRVGKVALARGLFSAAAARFKRAAQIDPSLAGERDLGLAAVQDAETADLLAEAEGEARRGRNDLAVSRAKVAAERAPEGSALRLKAEGLVALAGKLADRDREHAAKVAADKAAKAEAAERAAFDASVLASDKAISAALGQRAHASDPDVTANQARQALEAADLQIREARRLLVVARDNPAARLPELDPRERAAFDLLLSNHLDLADLYRAERRFDKARDRVRAVLVMDPQNSRAQTTSDRIEQDVRTPAPPPYEPAPYPYFESGVYGGYGGYGGYAGYGYGLGGVNFATHYSAPYRYFPYVSPYYRSSYLLGRWNHGAFFGHW